MQIAFSTVACPDWTLDRVMSFADEAEYDGVELRTFGWGGTDFTCEPALTDPVKIRRMGIETGTHVMCLGTSLKFDDAIWPPVIGRVLPGHDRWLQDARRFIALADDLECPHLRVFGFESQGGEPRRRTVARVAERLNEVLAAAGKHRISIALENGGSFSRAQDLLEIIEACRENPWMHVTYNVAVGAAAGDDVEDALERLGGRLASVKLKDLKGNQPVEIGEGEVPLERAVKHLARVDYDGWVVVEWMRYWRPELAEPAGVLGRSIKTIEGWMLEACDRPLSPRRRAVSVGA